MSYVDGFVVPVPDGRRAEYEALCPAAGAVFLEHGAIRVVECWGDDVPDGQVTDFRRAVAAEPGEAVVFSWIVWPSKAVRDDAQPKVMNDPRLRSETMPFDGRRMIWGGFVPIFDTGSDAPAG